MKQTFKVRLSGRGPSGVWTFLPVPFGVGEKFASRAGVAVAGTTNNFPFSNTLVVEGYGTHSTMASKPHAWREDICVKYGS